MLVVREVRQDLRWTDDSWPVLTLGRMENGAELGDSSEERMEEGWGDARNSMIENTPLMIRSGWDMEEAWREDVTP